jgi:hypothetical protein
MIFFFSDTVNFIGVGDFKITIVVVVEFLGDIVLPVYRL